MRVNVKQAFTNLLVLFLPLVIYSQKHVTKHKQQYNFGVNQGLPSSEVYEVKQDKNGYLWALTDRGVAKFDGIKWNVFTLSDGLGDNTLLKMHVNLDSSLTFFGFNKSLTTFKNGNFKSHWISDSLFQSIAYDGGLAGKGFDAKGNYVLGTFDGVNHLEYSFLPNYELIEQKTFNNNVLEFGQDRRSSPFNITRKNVEKGFEIEWEGQRVVKFSNLPNLPLGYALTVRIQPIGASKGYLVSIHNHLFYCVNGEVVDQIELKSEAISDFAVDHNQFIWIGFFQGGAFRFEENKKLGECDILLPNLSISSILEDNENGHWFSSLEHGIYYYPRINIENYPAESVNSIWLNKNGFWVTNNTSEVVFYTKKENELIGVATTKNWNYPYGHWIKLQHFFGDSISKLNTLTHKRTVHSWIRKTVLTDSTLWTAANLNLYAYNTKGQPLHIDTLPHRVFCIAELIPNQKLLLGTINGAFLYRVADKSLSPLSNSSKLKCRINEIYKLSENVFVFGTHGNGLIIKSDTGTQGITTKNGLLSNTISQIEYFDHKLWVGSNQGISILEKNETGKFHVVYQLSSANGLLSNEINDIQFWEDKLYVASKKGLSIVDALNYEVSNKLPFGISLSLASGTQLGYKHSYNLDYREKHIQIHLQAVSFKGPKQIHYKYKLKGVDKDWLFTKENTLNYSLTPGEYEFKAYAGVGYKNWSNHPITFTIAIEPPFWKTIWFWVLIHLALAAVITLITRQYQQKKRKKLEAQKSLDNSKLEALGSQMNPHFIFNSLNSIQSLIINENKKVAAVQVAKFSRLIRRILSNSKNSLIPLSESIETLTNYMELEQFRTKNKFSYQINIAPAVKSTQILVPPLMLQPYVENAIWHGIIPKSGKGKIVISIDSAHNQIEVSIRDNGVGRSYHKGKTKMQSSMGVDISKKRIELLNNLFDKQVEIQTIDHYKDEEAIGTEVIFQLPIIKSENGNK